MGFGSPYASLTKIKGNHVDIQQYTYMGNYF